MNPVLLELGPFQIRYYGILMALAFILGYFIIKNLGKRYKVLNEEQASDFIVYMVIGILLGARLAEILIYQPSYYFANPLKILFIWEGGLASHGGMIGGIIAAFLFCRKHKKKFYDVADIAVIPIALGAAFIRIGNFTNSEIVGRISDVPWAMEFEGYEGLRHPSQLYEAFKNILLSVILYFIRSSKKFPRGFTFWSFITIFGIFRFIVEFWKDWPLHYGLTMGQILSIPLIIVGGIMLIIIWRRTLTLSSPIWY